MGYAADPAWGPGALREDTVGHSKRQRKVGEREGRRAGDSRSFPFISLGQAGQGLLPEHSSSALTHFSPGSHLWLLLSTQVSVQFFLSERPSVPPCHSSKHHVLCLCNSYYSLVFCSSVCPLYSQAGTHTECGLLGGRDLCSLPPFCSSGL